MVTQKIISKWNVYMSPRHMIKPTNFNKIIHVWEEKKSMKSKVSQILLSWPWTADLNSLNLKAYSGSYDKTHCLGVVSSIFRDNVKLVLRLSALKTQLEQKKEHAWSNLKSKQSVIRNHQAFNVSRKTNQYKRKKKVTL